MAIRKKNYRAFGYIRQLGPNKFQASFKRNGKTHHGPSVFYYKTEAENWLAEKRTQIARGPWGQTEQPSTSADLPMTFGEYAARHIVLQTNSKGTPLKPSTQHKYRSYLANGLAEFSELRVSAITKTVVDEWWMRMVTRGHLTTASKHYKLLRCVMERAVNDRMLGEGVRNPCQVKGAQNACSNRPTRTLTMNEATAIASHINPRFRALVLLLANAGLRFGEVTALKRKHFRKIDGASGERYIVNIEEGVVLVDGEFIEGLPKSAAGIREIALPTVLTPAIDDHLAGAKVKSPDALVFPAANGNHLRNDVLNKAMKGAAKRANVEVAGVAPHAFRRGAATAYSNVGANIAEVQEFLGDASPAAALRYIASTNRQIDLIERFGSV